MKKLTLVSHTGEKLLELDVFVDGVDFNWTSPKPQAYWLGEIHLTDKPLPIPTEEVRGGILVIDTKTVRIGDMIDESKKVNNQDTRDERISPTGKFDGVKVLLEQRKRDSVVKGNQGTGDGETTENTMGSRT